MTWVIAGLLAPFLWAATNLIDQIVIRKYYPNQATLIMAINGLIQFIPFAILAALYPSVFAIEIHYIAIFITTSLINVLGFIAYYKALEIDEASNTIPIFQIEPIIVFIGAYFLFGETITWLQGIGSALIIFAAISLLVDLDTKKINSKTLYLIGFCTIILSATALLDRYLLKDFLWMEIFAWKAMGYVVFSFIIFAVRPSILIQTIGRIRHPIKNGFQFIIVVEMIATCAYALVLFALSLAPAAGFVLTLNGFSPIFALALGYLGYKLIPEFVKKPKEGKHLAMHLACLAIMLFGLYLIY